MRRALIGLLMLAAGTEPVGAHRLDEYLQATIITVEKSRLQIEMTMTPGVAVSSFLLSTIDTDGDGTISETEQHAYAERVLRDISVEVDGFRLQPQLRSVIFPALAELKDGSGEIKLNFDAGVPGSGRNQTLTFENHHQSRISAYQINCLVPRDPALHIASQERNYTQSLYRMRFVQSDSGFDLTRVALWSGGIGWLGLAALFVQARARLSRREAI